jgi:hypothetical protein
MKRSLDENIYPILGIAAIVMLVLMCVHWAAWAHDNYPAECCSNKDCFKVSPDELVEKNNGDWLYLPRNLTFPKHKVRPSFNGHFHVCIGTYEFNMGEPLCAFIVQGS